MLRLFLILGLAAPLSARAGVRQLTHDGQLDQLPRVNNAGQVVWQKESNIYLWDGFQVRRLTDSRHAANPQINDAGQVVWDALAERGREIDLWDGVAVRPLTDGLSWDIAPKINRAGQVIWSRSSSTGVQLYLWDGATPGSGRSRR